MRRLNTDPTPDAARGEPVDGRTGPLDETPDLLGDPWFAPPPGEPGIDLELEAELARAELHSPAASVWAPDIEEWDPDLDIPRRPLPWWPAPVLVVVVLGWLGWSAFVLPRPVPLRWDTMAGFAYEDEEALADRPRAHLGELEETWPSEAANFSGDAEPLPPPRPGDWLYEYPERGQTYTQFVFQNENRLSPSRSTIYILPLGVHDETLEAVAGLTREVLGVYYNAPTEMLPPVPLPVDALVVEQGQYDARRVIEELAVELPADGLGLVAITDADLTLPTLNYVFGLGSARHRVAVFSTFRYEDDVRLTGEHGALLRRSATVAVHEFGHVLGMRHCTEFRCLMNGTSSLQGADAHTLHLCPVCLRKAQYAIGFDREERYERLHAWYVEHGFVDEARFAERRLDALQWEAAWGGE